MPASLRAARLAAPEIEEIGETIMMLARHLPSSKREVSIL
jgi:hypothetical protein